MNEVFRKEDIVLSSANMTVSMDGLFTAISLIVWGWATHKLL